MQKNILEDSEELYKILQHLGATKPYLSDGGLSKSGEKSYNKLVQIIYSIEKMGFNIGANQIIDKMDKFTTEGDFCSKC
ncbi:hypothetical protein [Capnocytophaga sp.]|uniref:hypothetical protein n=1 Tax=Capnocytophaga sp. TaxID=44737 RepID=UPI0026DD707C|nr:hypothetical protein [Capnocytophaga sp.]MDO5106176.1 hypothetical protein [Capnocytophaga sp.]